MYYSVSVTDRVIVFFRYNVPPLQSQPQCALLKYHLLGSENGDSLNDKEDLFDKYTERHNVYLKLLFPIY